MQYLYQLIRKYPFSVLLILVIWYLSFFTPPKTELDNVEFIDKWVHIIMYGGTCGVIWLEYLRRHSSLNAGRLFLMAWLAPVIMSGAIELLQEHCTDGRRSGDWLDLTANAVGVTLAALFGILAARKRPKD
jgi:VanZ family protein